MNLSGTIPQKRNTSNEPLIVMAGCDPVYLRDHGPAFVASLALSGNSCHIHVVDPEAEDHARWMHDLTVGFYKLRKNRTQDITFTESVLSLYGLSKESIRTYYACSRFLAAELIMELSDVSLFITDIDCVAMDHIPEPNADLGLFIRQPLPGTIGWEAEGTTIAAGAVYYSQSQNMRVFRSHVVQTIEDGPLNWFLDQVALSRAYNSFGSWLRVHQYTKEFLDWEFLPGTVIWTGKGPRKTENATYVAKKHEFTEIFYRAIS